MDDVLLQTALAHTIAAWAAERGHALTASEVERAAQSATDAAWGCLARLNSPSAAQANCADWLHAKKATSVC